MTLTPTFLREYDRAAPDREATTTATFGLGCFWGPDAEFGATAGVVRTRVGYAGGTTAAPTYRSIGDHTEVVQVDFDPAVVEYADLVRTALRSHDPRRQARKQQYQNLILTTGDQRDVVESVLAERGLSVADVETRVESLSRFTPAEDYHQKYSLRSGGLPDAFEAAGYDDAAVRESPAAARLNGRAAGHDLPSEDDLRRALERPTGGR